MATDLEQDDADGREAELVEAIGAGHLDEDFVAIEDSERERARVLEGDVEEWMVFYILRSGRSLKRTTAARRAYVALPGRQRASSHFIGRLN